MKRTSTENDNQLDIYWNDISDTRKTLIDLLYNLLNNNSNKHKSILEFGSHVGINLKLLSERLPGVKMFAVEPNVEAYEFLASNLPFIEVRNFDDVKFIHSDFPNQKINISFVNSVFYCMKPKKVLNVLEKLSSISETIVIGDSMSNIEKTKSKFNQEPIFYSHPYKMWLKELGYTKFKLIPLKNGQLQLDAYLIAQK
jgi:hypothetical protein